MKLKKLLNQPEGRRLEFKEKFPKKSDLCKTIIAFANDAGGDIYIGVKDSPREVIGILEDEIFIIEEKISNIVFDNCYPLINPDISIVNIDNKLVLKVRVYRGSNIPYYLKSKGKTKGTYIRVGSSNRQATDEIIQELERQKRHISFDSEPVFDIKTDLNIDKVKSLYFKITGAELDTISLKKLQLLKPFQDELQPTNALLLISDDPLKQQLFPYAKIECARFKGTTVDNFIDRKTMDGNLLEQVELAYDFVLRHINQSAVTEGVYTKTKWQYPIKAIREVIRNAVIHRDYSLIGKDIKVAIYDHMIEITSPGKLPPSINYNDMESRQSEIRNRVIAPFFKHLGLIDQWGNGLKLIANELKHYDKIDLKWFEVGLQFQVQLLNKQRITDQATDQATDQVTDQAADQVNDQAIDQAIDQTDKDTDQATDQDTDQATDQAIDQTDKDTDQVTDQDAYQVTDQVKQLLTHLNGEMLSSEIRASLKLKHNPTFRHNYLIPALKLELIEMTRPNKPKSPVQKYRLTSKGKDFLIRSW